MDFRATLIAVDAAFRAAGIDFALIGGFALAAHGAPRATGDLDFLVPGECADAVDGIMRSLGYRALHRSEEAANYKGDAESAGHVDFLFARRAYSREMLRSAKSGAMTSLPALKIVAPEDLIGLKVQASSNNPKRRAMDLADIGRLLAVHPSLDLARVRRYFQLFNREEELEQLLRQSGDSDE